MKGKRKLTKRIAAWLMCLAMVLTTINLPAFTTEVKAEEAEEGSVTFWFCKCMDCSGRLGRRCVTCVYGNHDECEFKAYSGEDCFEYTRSWSELYVDYRITDTSIGGNAFGNADFGPHPKSIIIPNGITDIEDEAFQGCYLLESITIPDSVINIGDNVFDTCNLLTNVIAPCTLASSVDSWKGTNSAEVTYTHKYAVKDSDTHKCLVDGCAAEEAHSFTDGVCVCGYKESCSQGNHNFLDSEGNPVKNCTLCNTTNTQKCGEDVYYTYSEDGKTLYIYGTGPMTDYDWLEGEMAPWYSESDSQMTDVVISDGVTSIGNDSFRNCKNITNIVIPDSVENIGAYSLSNCIGITSITFGEKSKLESIGDYAFYSAMSFTKIVIPDNVKTIGESAFEGCSDLKNITFGENSKLESIGTSAFWGTSFSEIKIPNSVSNIGANAFSYCRSLNKIIAPCGLNNKDLSWKGNYTATITWSHNFPDDAEVVKIDGNKHGKLCTICHVVIVTGNHDFSESEYQNDGEGKHYRICALCTTESEHEACSGGTATCTDLATCSVCKTEYGAVDSTNHKFTTYTSDQDATCLVDGHKTAICDYGCNEKDTVVDEGSKLGHNYKPTFTWSADGKSCSLTFICDRASCTAETDGHSGTYDCAVTSAVKTPATCVAKGTTTYTAKYGTYTDTKDVEDIEQVEHTWDAGTVTTPATCKVKGVKTFKCTVDGCTGTKTEEIAVNANNHVNTEILNAKDATCIEKGSTGDTYCKDCGTKLAVAEEIAATGIHSYAFGICVMCKKAFSFVKDGLEYTIVTEEKKDEDGNVSIVPKKVTTKDSEGKEVTSVAVSVKADQDADVKGAVTIPATVANEDMPFTVVAVEENAFAKTEVTSITLPETITEVGAGAFASETITEVAFTSVNAPTIDEKAFVGSKVTKVTVPEGAKDYDTQEALKSESITVEEKKEPAKDPEQKPSDSTEKPDSTTQDPNGTTEKPAGDNKPGDTTETSAKTGDTLKDDTGVSYTVADADKKTVVYTAPVNKNIKSVKVPDTVTIKGVTYTVTEIAANAFSGCTKLKSVTIGKNVTKIGANAFKNCKALTKLTLPAKVAKLGANVFSGCKKLKTLTIKNKKLKAKDINKKAFKGLTKKTTIKVPKKQVKTYKKMFKKKGFSSKVKVKA